MGGGALAHSIVWHVECGRGPTGRGETGHIEFNLGAIGITACFFCDSCLTFTRGWASGLKIGRIGSGTPHCISGGLWQCRAGRLAGGGQLLSGED